MPRTDTEMASTIAALYTRAEHPNTSEEEAAACMEKAHYLEAKYSLTKFVAEKLAADQKLQGPEEIVNKVVPAKGVYSKAFSHMAHQVATAVGCKLYQSRKHRTSDLDLHFVGFESDVDEAIKIYTSVLLQSANAWDRHQRGDWRWDRLTASQKYNEKRSFIVGYASGVGAKLRAVRRKVEEEVSAQPGAALVLVDRKAAVEKHYASLGLGKARGMKLTGAHAAGQAAGRNADVGQTGIGGSRGALPR